MSVDESVKEWQKINGDSTYALDWPLTNNSFVVEVGAYKGRWSKQIYDKYHCDIYAFEPQHWAYEELCEVASKTLTDGINSNAIIPKNYGLGTKLGDETLLLGEYETDACSLLLPGQRTQGTGLFRNINRVFEELNLRHIDLMMMNIEGYEYQLLGYMIGTNLNREYYIDRICIQWHLFADPDGSQYKSLARLLQENGYNREWSFYPTLECWYKPLTPRAQHA